MEIWRQFFMSKRIWVCCQFLSMSFWSEKKCSVCERQTNLKQNLHLNILCNVWTKNGAILSIRCEMFNFFLIQNPTQTHSKAIFLMQSHNIKVNSRIYLNNHKNGHVTHKMYANNWIWLWHQSITSNNESNWIYAVLLYAFAIYSKYFKWK